MSNNDTPGGDSATTEADGRQAALESYASTMSAEDFAAFQARVRPPHEVLSAHVDPAIRQRALRGSIARKQPKRRQVDANGYPIDRSELVERAVHQRAMLGSTAMQQQKLPPVDANDHPIDHEVLSAHVDPAVHQRAMLGSIARKQQKRRDGDVNRHPIDRSAR